MIAISADFDPVHKGHEQLIRKAREIADEKNIEVAIYKKGNGSCIRCR